MHVAQILVVIILIVLTIVVVGGLVWNYKSTGSSQDSTLQLDDDLRAIRDVMINDSHLQRLLMIEIINDKSGDDSKHDARGQTPSEAVTFTKMSGGISSFGKGMVRSFGVAIAQRIATLMQKRNEILRDYYRSMRSVVCQNGNCVHVIQMKEGPNNDKGSRFKSSEDFGTDDTITESSAAELRSKNESVRNIILPMFPPSASVEQLDITVITHKKLEAITREITDSIAASFHIRDVDSGSGKKRPLVHYQRLFNLITMYDKELVNQAKSYAFKHYDISMNCAQSSLEISQHISDEFGVLMKESQQNLQTMQ